MMKARNYLSYVLMSIGFILGFSQFLLDKWLDSHNYPKIIFPWSIVIVAYMVFGGVIGRLLNKIFEEQRKKEEVTERKRAEQELIRLHAEMAHLERLNLVAQMAAGIAHETRNPMTIVRGYLQLLGTRPEFLSQKSTFDLMIGELDRADIIISDFLSITKESPTKLNYQNIDEIMQHLYPLLEADAYSQKKQILYQAGVTSNILMNPDEISQLVLNLCRNGLEAMEVGGTITIRTYLEDEKVVLSIEDEGEGIKTEYIERIGTPFFTTKENGTGLGLSTCYNIAGRNNAKIDFKCSPSGTTFFVRFFSAVNEIGSLASQE